MINPINSTIMRTNDALSKEDRRENRRNRKGKGVEEEEVHEEEGHASVEAGEDLTLDLVA